MLGVFSLCAGVEQSIAPTNTSPTIPAIDNSPPHRARNAYNPAAIAPSSLASIRFVMRGTKFGVGFAAVDNGTGASGWKNKKEFQDIFKDKLF